MIFIKNQIHKPTWNHLLQVGICRWTDEELGWFYMDPVEVWARVLETTESWFEPASKLPLGMCVCALVSPPAEEMLGCRVEWPYPKPEHWISLSAGIWLLTVLASSPLPPRHTVSLCSASRLLSLQQNIWISLPWARSWPLPPWPASAGPRGAGKKPLVLTGVENQPWEQTSRGVSSKRPHLSKQGSEPFSVPCW